MIRISRGAAAVALAASLLLSATLSGCATQREPVKIGLITKQEDNPYWISLRQVAQATARSEGVELLTATGNSDVDVAGQREAIASMLSQDVDGIVIAPTDSTQLNADIEAARKAGVTVITIDTPIDPATAADAFFGTDNYRAGQLVGQYAVARAADLDLKPQVAILDLAPGINSGVERRAGFLDGFQLTENDPRLLAEAETQGDEQLGREAMARLLDSYPGINVVYAVNEPAALGAIAAIKEQGRDLNQMVVVAVDGGCAAMRQALRPGDLDATAMQFPHNMARESVKAIAAQVRDGTQVSTQLDTGAVLVSETPASGVESRNVEYGIRNCWG